MADLTIDCNPSCQDRCGEWDSKGLIRIMWILGAERKRV
jgi:hypothetical protein